MKIAVLGASGMLGSMLVDYLSKYYQIVATTRSPEFVREMPNVEWRQLDALFYNPIYISDAINYCDYAINAIGLIKHNINENNVVDAINTNSLFPNRLAEIAKQWNCKVIQIETDCVFSGSRSGYLENDVHDADDVYGKTKSLGEACSPDICHLRCSLIGSELKTHKSLMDWFLFQPKNTVVEGYVNHIWNGITTLHFAKICRGIINHKLDLPSLQHVVPFDAVDKAMLLQYLAMEFGRGDITIKQVSIKPSINRTLATLDQRLNNKLWVLAGYSEKPTIKQMVKELVEYIKAK